MLLSLAPDTLHKIVIDLPLGLVILGSLLFIAATISKSCPREFTVPAVMLTILGASSLFAFYVDSRTVVPALPDGQPSAELLQHQRHLGLLTVKTLVAAALLFAIALLFCRLVTHNLSQPALHISAVGFSIAYVTCCVWLIVVAHQGQRLANHLASHARP